jgi:hypothetical protein
MDRFQEIFSEFKMAYDVVRINQLREAKQRSNLMKTCVE